MKKSFRSRVSAGFTLIELMIVVAIVGILAAIAIPTYRNYTDRAYYSGVISAIAPYKAGVEECASRLGVVAGCNAGANNVPAGFAGATTGAVGTLAVADGVISATPIAKGGVTAADALTATPVITNGVVVWTLAGANNAGGWITQ